MKPNKLYAFWANSHGPWFKKPQEVYFDSELGWWWSKDGNADVRKIGYYEKLPYICFSSENKKEVEDFIKGYTSAMKIIKHITRNI